LLINREFIYLGNPARGLAIGVGAILGCAKEFLHSFGKVFSCSNNLDEMAL